MQLTAREAQDLHELALSCVNSITNMACFINQVKDIELKALLQKHFPLHIKDYNMKVEYLSKAEGAGCSSLITGNCRLLTYIVAAF